MAPLSWWPFLVLIFVLAIFAQVYPLAAFTVMLAVISVTARWWQRHALDGVSYRRLLYFRRGFMGETIDIRLEVENRKFLPMPWLRIFDYVPNSVGPEDESQLQPTHMTEIGTLISLFSLRWYERDHRSYRLLLRKRGIYRLGPPQLESGDLFGLFEQEREDELTLDYLTVFPEPLPFEALRMPSEDPFGDRRARRRLYEDPNQPMGVREYQPDDDFRRVHWPATAHTGEIQVKVYRPVSAQVMVVCLNVTTMSRYWEGTDIEMLEYLVRATAALVQHGLQDGYRVGLVSNGCLAHADQPFRVPPGRSSEQLTHLLTALAGVTPFVSAPFDRFLLSEMPRLPYGATLVMVTTLVSPALAESLLRMHRHARRITLLVFGSQPPPHIPGITIHHLPLQRGQR